MNDQNPDPTDDDIMAQQAKLLEAKMKAGGVKKKPLIQKQRTQFDSADYFKDKAGQKEGEGQ